MLAGMVWATPRASSATDPLRGTWVLQEASSVEALDRVAPQIRTALAAPGVIGLSVRVPWRALEPAKGVYDLSVLARAKQIAGTDQLAIRFMAGRFTPGFRMGHSMIYDGSATGGSGRGAEVPLPFGRTGGPNEVFERGWKRLVNQLVDWATANGVRLVHMSWPGLLWAELALVDQMTGQPGYTYEAARDTHLRLLDHALRRTTSTLRVSFASTGHAPSQLNVDIKNHLLENANVQRVYLQANNLSPTTGASAKSPPPPRRGGQVVGGSNSYDWAKVYDQLEAMYGEYLEVYTSSFSGGTSSALLREAAAFV